MFRRYLAALVICGFAVSASAAPDVEPDSPEAPVSADQVFADAMRLSVGAPARADLGTEATVRLQDGALVVPHDPAVRLLRVNGKDVPADFLALLITSKGMESPGYIRFVPAGFIDANAALGWTADDMLDSLRDTVEQANADRIAKGLPEREARRWIRPPHYNAELHTLTWAALISQKSAPRESDGEIVMQGLVFGRDGYIQLSIPSSVEEANEIGATMDSFLVGVAFKPNKTYQDVLPNDPRAPEGLAGAMGLKSLHKVREQSSLFSADVLVPTVGAMVAAIGALSLFLYVQRHMRRLARRV